MKKVLYLLMVMFTISSVNVIAQDGFKKMKSNLNMKFEKQETKVFFYGSGTGTADEDRSARKIAQADAQQQLSEVISVKIKTGTESYLKATNKKSGQDFDNVILTVSKNIISEIEACGSQLYYNKEKNEYRVELLIKVDKQKILEKTLEKMKEVEELKLDYDKEKFKKELEKEWDKL